MAEILWYIDPDATGAADGTSWTDAYTSWNSFNSAEAIDLVSATNNYVVHHRSSSGTMDTTLLTYTGWTTSLLYDIVHINDDDHEGKWASSNVYTLQGAGQNVLVIQEGWITLRGMQMERTSMTANYQGILLISSIPSGAITILDSCIFKGANNATYRERLVGIASETVYMYNCLLWNANVLPLHVTNSSISISGATVTAYLYNNTFSGGSSSTYYGGVGVMTGINNIFVGAGNSVDGTWTASDYNASDKSATTGGANDITSATFTFTDSSNGDFSLTAGDSSGCKDGGTDDPGSGLYSDDLAGVARVSSWDIGALEFVTGGTTTIIDLQLSEINLLSFIQSVISEALFVASNGNFLAPNFLIDEIIALIQANGDLLSFTQSVISEALFVASNGNFIAPNFLIDEIIALIQANGDLLSFTQSVINQIDLQGVFATLLGFIGNTSILLLQNVTASILSYTQSIENEISMQQIEVDFLDIVSNVVEVLSLQGVEISALEMDFIIDFIISLQKTVFTFYPFSADIVFLNAIIYCIKKHDDIIIKMTRGNYICQ